MVFIYSFYIAAVICVLGIVYRTGHWFSYNIGSQAERFSVSQRIGHASAAAGRTLFSAGIVKLLFTFVADVVLQVRILKKDPLRWVMHFSIFAGFMLLLFMHALEDQVSRSLFSVYEPTLNPYMFLRNLFGFMVLLGLGIAIYRRYRIKKLRRITGGADRFILAFLVVIILSGFLLEAAKIVSPTVFYEMVEIYSGMYGDEAEVQPLKSVWAAEYGVAFPGEMLSFDAETMADGRFMNESYCAFCHARPDAAFVSYPMSKIIKPAVPLLERIEFHRVMWYVHFLSCFIALALLPFTKFFHIFSTPVSLLVNGVSGRASNAGRSQGDGQLAMAAAASRRALDLDGCTHCGTCTLHCSVAPAFELIGNICLLPSERLKAVKRLADGKPMAAARLHEIAEGNLICSKCNRCTELCPSGLNLQDIWLACQEQLAVEGAVHPGIWVPQALAQTSSGSQQPNRIGPGEDVIDQLVTVSVSRDDFSECLKCKTCTNSCPVVACSEDPAGELDLLPHQMMHALSLGLKDMVLGSKMIWSCTTCYMCQEHCPQAVKITDIFYGLKNLAYRQAKQDVLVPEAGRFN